VLHELVLYALSKGTTERARNVLLSSIFRTLPAMIKRSSTLPDPSAATASALNRVLSWWSALKVFPDPWIAELRAPILSGGGAEGLGVAEELRVVNRLLLSFNASRDALHQLQTSAAEGDDAAARGAAINAAREDAVHRLVHLQKAVDGRGGAATSLTAYLQAELVRLCGAGTGEAQPPGASDGHVAMKVEDDNDILGSFF
jgi:hypothetical protein